MDFENKEHIAVFIERHLKELGGEAYGVPYIAEKLWQWHENQVKNCDLADVVGQREQITTFCTWLEDNYGIKIPDMVLQDYIRYGG